MIVRDYVSREGSIGDVGKLFEVPDKLMKVIMGNCGCCRNQTLGDHRALNAALRDILGLKPEQLEDF